MVRMELGGVKEMREGEFQALEIYGGGNYAHKIPIKPWSLGKNHSVPGRMMTVNRCVLIVSPRQPREITTSRIQYARH